MESKILLTILAALSGALHIYFDYQKNLKATYLFKPLVCFLLIIMVLRYGQDASSSYRNWILAGLFFSMVGDICLMLENEKFIQGLISFLIAHICYIVAFSLFIDLSGQFSWVLFALLLITAFFVWRYIYPTLGEMNIPVIVYITAIITMCAAAGTWFEQAHHSDYAITTPAIFAFLGALWFMASDTNLSINKFKNSYHWAQLVTLSTYYIAQVLIAWSVLMLVN